MTGDQSTSRHFGHPEQIPPVEPEQLKFVVLLAASVDVGATPSANPADYGFVIDNEDDTFDEYTFGDTRENRVGSAIAKHFGPDPDLFTSIITRMRVLMIIWHRPRFEERAYYPNPSSEEIAIKEEVFDVAASLPLNTEGEFDEDQFFRRVRELVEERKPEDTRAA